MATTTNYSWTTPDDTDLVKDGASAIRALGTAIDTTVYNNSLIASATTLISTTSLSGNTVNLTSIPGTYKHLQLIVVEVYASSDSDFNIRLNNDTGATSYDDSYIRNRSGSISGIAGNSRDAIRIGDLKGASTRANRFSVVINIPRYTDTSQNALVLSQGRTEGINTGNGTGAAYYGARTAAITQINILCSGGTFSAGTAYLYGVS